MIAYALLDSDGSILALYPDEPGEREHVCRTHQCGHPSHARCSRLLSDAARLDANVSYLDVTDAP